MRIHGAPIPKIKTNFIPFCDLGDMSNYIRPRQYSASIFFTVALADRTSNALTQNVEILRDAVRKTRAERPFSIDAFVVLPDHLHAVWTLSEGDTDYSTRWSVIKARVSREMPFCPRRQSHMARREHGFWQRRFWEHHIRTEAEKAVYIEYCWNNPLKHGLVETLADWPYSSWHRDYS